MASSLLTTSLLALSLLGPSLTSASPLPPVAAPRTLPRQSHHRRQSSSSTLPSFNVVQRFASGPPPPGAITVADADRARAAGTVARGQSSALRKRDGGNSTSSSGGGSSSNGTAQGTNVPITNVVVSYLAQVDIGSPATTYELLIDTGSSNTWTGASAQNPFVPTSTTVQTGEKVSVSYGSGQMNGSLVLDTVSIQGLTVKNMSIGATTANQQVGFDDTDGIVGVGPIDLTLDTLSPDTKSTIPTITQELFRQGAIDAEMIGVSFAPTALNESQNGVLTFGGVDESQFIGDIVYQPVTKTLPAGEFWGANISLTLGTNPPTQLSGSMAGIVDTGTTLLMLNTNVFNKYASAIPGATLDTQHTGLLQIPISSLDQIPDLLVSWGDTQAVFPLTADGQVFPKALNPSLGGSEDFAYGVVNDLGTPAGEGLDFILGMEFLERFYAAFNTNNNSVGLAITPQTNMTFFNTPVNPGANSSEAAAQSTSGAADRFGSRGGLLWAACAGVAAAATLMQ